MRKRQKRVDVERLTIIKFLLIYSIKKIYQILRWFWVRLLFICIAIFLTSIIYFYFLIPPFDFILDGRSKGSVTLLDKNGKTFALRGHQFDRSLRETNASRFLVEAIISSEDKKFYSHFGVSIRGILGAIRINLREGRGPFQGHGGSTITQQVAKLLCLLNNQKVETDCRKQSIARKILEIPFAIALEIKFSKSEILSIYMNRVYLGASSIGFEAAANRYFSKSATEVSLAEAAMLAALLQAPSRYAPTKNLSLARERAKLVIRSMLKERYISRTEADDALKKPAKLSATSKMTFGTHFADWVMQDAPKSLTIKTTEDILIKTTFDPKIQKIVEESVSSVFASRVRPNSKAEAAVVVMSATGDVVAMLGSRKNTKLQGQYNRAFHAYRQPGSAFKPFVYATALQQGYLPNYLLDDRKAAPPQMAKLNYWPKNYNNNYLGKIPMDFGLANSVNTVTVQLAHLVGIKNVVTVATGLGIKSKLSPNLSLALGSSEVSLLNLTSAYNGILNLGRRMHPRGWSHLRLKSTNEVLIESSIDHSEQTIDENVSKALIKMLVSTIESGTGKEARIDGWHLAGKTGTSQDARDAWFIGFSSAYVVGVWIGADDNTPLEGVFGGNLPLQIWSDIIRKIHVSTPNILPTLSSFEFQKSLYKNFQSEKNFKSLKKNKPETNNFFRNLLDYLQRKNN